MQRCAKHKDVAIIIWATWTACNKLMHEGKRQSVGDLVVFIHNYCTELDSLTLTSHKSNLIVSPSGIPHLNRSLK